MIKYMKRVAITRPILNISSEAIRLAKLGNKKYTDLFPEDDVYYDDYNIGMLFQVFEHIQGDLATPNKIKAGIKVIFFVPNFYSKSYVRLFNNEEEIIDRYDGVVEME